MFLLVSLAGIIDSRADHHLFAPAIHLIICLDPHFRALCGAAWANNAALASPWSSSYSGISSPIVIGLTATSINGDRRIGIDVTSALTQGGGIGRYTRELVHALAALANAITSTIYFQPRVTDSLSCS